MARGSRALGGGTWLVIAVLLLLPALAWLQYDWVNQLALADRDRRERTLRAAASQFTSAVDTELSRVGASLQLDGAMVERRDWDAYALRYESALTNAATAALVQHVWYVERVDGAGAQPMALALHEWRADDRAFAPVAWPADLTDLRDQMSKFMAVTTEAPGNPRERLAASFALGDERTLVLPIVKAVMPAGRDVGRRRMLPDVQMRGFTVIALALDTLTTDRLPALVAEHFPESSDYRVAIVARESGRVVFESEPGAAAATADAPDHSASFLQPRVGPMMVFARAMQDGRPMETHLETMAPPPPPPPAPGDGTATTDTVVSIVEVRGRDGDRTMRARAMNHAGPGHWTLRVKHRAGSLEAAVADARRRNLMLSGGVLALLGVSIGLIGLSARRAQALARQQMEFVAAVSHELRTPVAVINSAAGNLADGVVGDATRVKQYGTAIQTEARRLGETVERVLQLAGLEAGRTLPVLTVAPADVVRSAVDQCAADAARAGVDVVVDIAPALPSIVGDPGGLQSAVQNLVGNAVKYAGDDRWVRVAVTAGGSPASPVVRIAVADHGAGLDHDERRLVFEPFYRGRRAVADQVHGSGLGLSLVKRIVDAHGGHVELASEPGAGSTFTMVLPAVADASNLATAGDAATPSPLPSRP